jgi:hypothetical protein
MGDMRISIIICLQSGGGQLEFKKFARDYRPQDDTFESPTSLHPEQLIGKTIRERGKGKTVYDKISGFLVHELVVFEEALRIFGDPYYEDAFKYIRISLDPIGDNTLEKSNTDAPLDEKINFDPDCTEIFIIHDKG